jgi:hypothetical protein
MTIRPPGLPVRALGFRLDPVPGIPYTDSLLIRAIRLAEEAPAFAGVPEDERVGQLSSLAETLSRARYHKLRFDESVEVVKRRRLALGGPVVADWHAVRPAICEAAAFLGAVRTLVDIVVYLAARRAGKSPSSASDWQASDAINPPRKGGATGSVPTRYDVPEVLEIRKRQPWFDDLNLYRNAVYHRGWGGESYGYYFPSELAEEANDPSHNAFLLPDRDALVDRKLPHEWTYSNRQRLDDFVESIYVNGMALLEEVVTKIWGQALPADGSVPVTEQPDTLLTLPFPAYLQHPGRKVLPVFTSVEAARSFPQYGARRQELTIRAVAPTTLGDDPPGFLLPVPLTSGEAPCEIHVHDLSGGLLLELAAIAPERKEHNPVEGVVCLRIEGREVPLIYLWQPARPST